MRESITIVIAGGGYGGVNTATALAHNLKKVGASGTRIILIDRNDYHLYQPNLYEVATSEEEFTSISDLKNSVALPFTEILPKSVEFKKANVELIDQERSFIVADKEKINYDYLVLSLGAVMDYFGISGMISHSFSLKSLPDALKIRNQLEFLVQSHRLDVNKKLIRLVIGGGGFSGVELAGEMFNLIDILSWKYNYPREKIELVIIEGANCLLPGMPSEIGERVSERLKSFGARIVLNTVITKVTDCQIVTGSGGLGASSPEEALNYDLLVWAGGVKGAPLPFAHPVGQDAKSRCFVNSHLTLKDSLSVFVIGDNACVVDKNRPLPMTATQAIYQAQYVAGAIIKMMQGKKVPAFKPKQFGYIIPVRGKWAVLHLPSGMTVFGFIAWIARRFADLRYFARLMPVARAFRLAWLETKLYIRND